jgi:hypothetical protein
MGGILVQKPQFDTAKLKEGTPVHVKSLKDRGGFYNFEKSCLIESTSPLCVRLAYIKKGSVEWKALPVGLVADGQVAITILQTPDYLEV